MTSAIFLLEILVLKAVEISEIFHISRFIIFIIFIYNVKSNCPLQLSIFYYFLVKESSSWVLPLGQDPLLPPQQAVGSSF